MFCTECGTKLVDGAKFCSECGAPVKAVVATPPDKTFWQREQEEHNAEAADQKTDAGSEAAEQKAEELNASADNKAEELSVTSEDKAKDQSEAQLEIDEELRAAQQELDETIKAAQQKLDEVIHAAKEPDYSKLNAEEIAKKYESEQPAESKPASDIKEPLQLSGMQKAIMFLAGASFLSLVISFSASNWLLKCLVILSAACLTFLAAKKKGLPGAGLVLPLSITAVSIVGSRIIQLIGLLLRGRRITIGLDVTLYRVVLIASVVMLLMICFSQDKKSRAMVNITAALFAVMAVFHLTNIIRYGGNGRATLMYNIGLMLFYVVYTLLAADYAKKIPAEQKNGSIPGSSTVDVHRKAAQPSSYTYMGTRSSSAGPEEHAERTYTATEKEFKAMPAEPEEASDKGLQSLPGDYIFCTRCGTRLPKDAVFCSKCGYPVSNPMIHQNN